MAALVLCGCIQHANQNGSAPVGPPLVIVEGAKDVRHTSEYDGSVQYWNEDAYPAEVTIARLDQLLSEAKWQQAGDDVLSKLPNEDLREWWTHDEPSGDSVRQWSGAWKNENGDVVTFVLRYRATKGKPIPRRLEIAGIRMTLQTVIRMREAAERMMRQAR